MRLTVAQWRLLDRELDNEVDIHLIELDGPEVEAAGNAIRRTIWRLAGGWSRERRGAQDWPPDEQVASVVLTPAQWRMSMAALLRWAEVSDQLGKEDEAHTQRAISDVIMAALTDLRQCRHGGS
ncbi:MAG: hypothetical protein HOV79_19605 [Hamadaea sp.]|nr:hypothetical protein [Hamadaea sp.]